MAWNFSKIKKKFQTVNHKLSSKEDYSKFHQSVLLGDTFRALFDAPLKDLPDDGSWNVCDSEVFKFCLPTQTAGSAPSRGQLSGSKVCNET